MMTEKYVPTGTPLTDHEREVLTILSEEAAEVICAATKLLRFGKENRPQTGTPDAGVSNIIILSREIGDLSWMIDLAMGLGLVRSESVMEGRERKERRLARYMQTSREPEPRTVLWRLARHLHMVERGELRRLSELSPELRDEYLRKADEIISLNPEHLRLRWLRDPEGPFEYQGVRL